MYSKIRSTKLTKKNRPTPLFMNDMTHLFTDGYYSAMRIY